MQFISVRALSTGITDELESLNITIIVNLHPSV